MLSDDESNKEISLSQLESYLWESANILRGPVDAADFKAYIFPLLFFKRISDVYDEEYAQALVESDGDADYASFAENHRFQIPEGAHWQDVREKTLNIGQAMQHAMREIEKANPDTLYGIFGDTKWSNKERLSDALLKDLIEHFSKLVLSNKNAHPDVLGQAYEYLIKKFADATNKKAGEFYTPRSAVRLLVDILDPKEGETVYDPACGTGGMLVEVVQHVKEQHGNTKRLWGKLFGQEKNLTTSGIARMNLFLHGVEDFKIMREDTLRNPAFFRNDKLAQFDCVIANPPFSLSAWGRDQWANDPFGRSFAGLAPDSNGDWAWVQHMIKSMKTSTGRMAVVLPRGVLFRSGQEAKIRQKILELDHLEAIIGLGPNLFYGTGISACILIFKAQKAEDKKERILLMDASQLYKKGRSQNTLEKAHADEMFKAYESFKNNEGFTKVVSLDDMKNHNWNLNISRYIQPVDTAEVKSLEEATTDLKSALANVTASEGKLEQVLTKAGLL